ncbi:MAG: polysaccharide biosynthesis/export family protein [Nitrospirae bacterium]|nr:polysaccharide biosynthesis/export family protein [Nitrospirota bacterium]
MQDKMRIFCFICLLLVFIILSACVSPRSREIGHEGNTVYIDEIYNAEKEEARNQIYKGLTEGLTEYRLTPGDVLEIMYHINSSVESNDYKLGVNDVLEIEFFYHPNMNRTLTIRPDGRITLPKKGDIKAAGLTTAELASFIQNAFEDMFKNPAVTVNVKEFSSKIADFKKALANSPRGQAKSFTISPDGYVYPPFSKAIRASGKTIDELKQEVNRSYRSDFNNLEVSVLLESIKGNRVFIFGEVRNPGVISVATPMTVLQAVTSVGGVLETGSLQEVRVLYWDKINEPKIRVLNLYNVMNNLRLEEDFIVPSNSIIFVPPTAIAKLNKVVDQYIKRLFLYNGAGLGFSYELHSESNQH